MSHRNSKKSNRIGQSIQKHRAQRNNPFEAEDREFWQRKDREELKARLAAKPPAAETTPMAPASPDEPAHPVSIPVSGLSGLSVLSVPLGLLDLSPVPSDSPSELSNLKSEIASPNSPPEISNLKSDIPSSSPSPSASALSTQNSALSPTDLAAAKAFIASKPATKAMHKLQSILDNHDFDFLNPAEVAQLSALMVVYAQLQNSAAVERISESLDQVGAGYKREPLTRELTKVLSIQDRALARAQREIAAKERDQRRIEREAKREQAQAAKQARDEKLFNQREDHLARKEKMLKDKLELTKLANIGRKHTPPQAAMQRGTGSPAGVGSESSSAPSPQHSQLSSQAATPPTTAPLLQAEGLEML